MTEKETVVANAKLVAVVRIEFEVLAEDVTQDALRAALTSNDQKGAKNRQTIRRGVLEGIRMKEEDAGWVDDNHPIITGDVLDVDIQTLEMGK